MSLTIQYLGDDKLEVDLHNNCKFEVSVDEAIELAKELKSFIYDKQIRETTLAPTDFRFVENLLNDCDGYISMGDELKLINICERGCSNE